MIPSLKRVKVETRQELETWLTRNAGGSEDVMIVTRGKRSSDTTLSRQDVRQALQDASWRAGRSYTLNGNLVGHIAHRA